MTAARGSFGQPRYFDDAACRPYPTRWWFADGADDVEAFVICTNCDLRTQCLTFALDHPDLVGIWAATTTDDRARMRRSHPSLGD